ncbi:uncharacterized protein B0T23DRAFT_381309 [Neurospora hispaniola]|uniref:Uncharacterized protein n=1 Tax=Neurospora hispaniola TaxID=588809 RepID=A0AAJ0I4P1_9PEZI|nr:hypothetical protein B0T23DRAFT_381309 [Neurospora hispaniola]
MVARTDWAWSGLPLLIGWSKYDLRECGCCGVAMLRFGRVKMVLISEGLRRTAQTGRDQDERRVSERGKLKGEAGWIGDKTWKFISPGLVSDTCPSP